MGCACNGDPVTNRDEALCVLSFFYKDIKEGGLVGFVTPFTFAAYSFGKWRIPCNDKQKETQ